jgi:hypothetical protein
MTRRECRAQPSLGFFRDQDGAIEKRRTVGGRLGLSVVELQKGRTL